MRKGGKVPGGVWAVRESFQTYREGKGHVGNGDFFFNR